MRTTTDKQIVDDVLFFLLVLGIAELLLHMGWQIVLYTLKLFDI